MKWPEHVLRHDVASSFMILFVDSILVKRYCQEDVSQLMTNAAILFHYFRVFKVF